MSTQINFQIPVILDTRANLVARVVEPEPMDHRQGYDDVNTTREEIEAMIRDSWN